MGRRLLAAGTLLPPVALCALALALHPEDVRPFLDELLWGAGLAAAFVGALTALLGLASVIADRFWPRPTPRLPAQPESHLLATMLAADVVVTTGLVIFWLMYGHLELAFWCGVGLGIAGSVAVLGFLGVLKRVEPHESADDPSASDEHRSK